MSGDKIRFDPTKVNGATISLSLTLWQIDIERTVKIDASMLPAGITIDANDPTPTTMTGDGIRASSTVTMIGLTLTGGDVSGEGGAIRSDANLILRDCVVDTNSASKGGGIFITGGVSLSILTCAQILRA